MLQKVKNISNRNAILIVLLFSIFSVFEENDTVCRFCVFFILVLCLILGKREEKLINPFFLFAFTPFSLLIYMNLGGRYMLPLSVETWVLAIINMLAFILALYYTPKFKLISNCRGIKNTRALIFSSLIFYVLSMTGRFVPQLQSLTWFLSIAAFVFAIKTKKKMMYMFCGFIFLSVSLSGHASKMGMLLLCVSFLICYDKFFVTSVAQIKKLFFLVVLGAFFMVFAFSFANKERGHYDVNEGVAYYEKQGNISWNYGPTLFIPYMYITTPWTNVEYVCKSQNVRTNGLWMLKPLLGYIGLKENFEREYYLEPYSSFNTFTFIICGFKDFGYWGSIIMSFFLGWYVKKIYSRYVVSNSPFDVTCYILVGLATVEMFFSNHFFMQSYPFTILIVMEFWKFVLKLMGQTRLEIE